MQRVKSKCKEWQNDINESNHIYFPFLKTANCVFIHSVYDEIYRILLKLRNIDFAVAVAKRTNVEKAAVVKFWRLKGKFENTDNVLCYDRKR